MIARRLELYKRDRVLNKEMVTDYFAEYESNGRRKRKLITKAEYEKGIAVIKAANEYAINRYCYSIN